MKIIGFISLILLVTLVLFSWGVLVDDFEKNYVETGISETTSMNSSFRGTYNRTEEINQTFSPLRESFEEIQTADGWFEKSLAAGSLPLVIISLPLMIFQTVGYAISDMTSLLNDMGIPPQIVIIGVVLLTLFGLFKLIEMFNKYPA